jgi:hypothetical protein
MNDAKLHMALAHLASVLREATRTIDDADLDTACKCLTIAVMAFGNAVEDAATRIRRSTAPCRRVRLKLRRPAKAAIGKE